MRSSITKLDLTALLDKAREKLDLAALLAQAQAKVARGQLRKTSRRKSTREDPLKTLFAARKAALDSAMMPGETWPDHFLKQAWLRQGKQTMKQLAQALDAKLNELDANPGGPAVIGDVHVILTRAGRSVYLSAGDIDIGILYRTTAHNGKSWNWAGTGPNQWYGWNGTWNGFVHAVSDLLRYGR